MRKSVTFAIMCHDNTSYLAELFRYLYNPFDVYLIHIDLKAPREIHILANRLSSSFSNVSIIPSVLCSWGGFTLVQTALDFIKYAISLKIEWSHLIFLSEQHLPVHDIGAINLIPDTCYFEHEPFQAMHKSARQDVLHRFSYHFRELKGIGAFACDPRLNFGEIMHQLYHGSQWIVLSRMACIWLINQSLKLPLWGHLRASALADETAIQSIVASYCKDTICSITNFNLTLVATPSIGGSKDMIFEDYHFWHAVETGRSFIRKRPKQLTNSVASYLDSMALLSNVEVKALISSLDPQSSVVEERKSYAERLVLELSELLKIYYGKINTIDLSNRGGMMPTMHTRLEIPYSSTNWTFDILSHDLSHFKIVLLAPATVNKKGEVFIEDCHDVRLIRARLWGLFHHNEINLGAEFDYGFVHYEEEEVVLELSSLIHKILENKASVFNYEC